MSSRPDAEQAARYERLRRERPELFRNPVDAAFEILPAELGNIDSVGVIYEDQWLSFVRDPVRFPDGALGGYLRLLPAGGGAAVLPVIDDEIVLLRHFRHATRSWHWEIPRGFSADPAEDPQATARRELLEEISAAHRRMRLLGVMHADTGISAAVTSLFWAELSHPPQGFESTEGISALETVDRGGFERLVRSGELTDSFTLSAAYYAGLAGLPPFAGEGPAAGTQPPGAG